MIPDEVEYKAKVFSLKANLRPTLMQQTVFPLNNQNVDQVAYECIILARI